MIFGVFYLVNFSVITLKENIIICFRNAWLLFIVALVLIVAILFTQTKTSLIEKELFRILSALVLYVSLSLVSIHKGLSFIKNKFVDIFLIYIAFIITFTLYKLINTEYTFYLFSNEVDFNMTAMYLIMSVIIIVYRIYSEDQTRWKVLLYNVFLVIITFIILTLSSRRGIIILSVLVFLILIGLILKKYRSKCKQIMVYIFIVFSVLTLSLTLFINNNFRHYLLYNVKSTSLSNSIIATAAKYYSIFEGNPDKVCFFSPPFIFGQIPKSKIIDDIKHNKDSNNIYKSINELALFVDSKDELISYIPEAERIPDSVFNKTKLTNLPLSYNVDYDFEYSFIPISFGNCILEDYNSNKNTFIFKSLVSGDNSRLLSFLPASDSSRFTLNFDYSSTTSTPQFRLLDFYSQAFHSIIKDTVISIDRNNKYKKIIVLDILKETADKIRFEIDFNSPELIISNLSWKRQQLSKLVINSPQKNTIEKKELYERTIVAIKNEHNPSDNRNVNIDSLFLMQDKIVFNQKFRIYARSNIDSSSVNFASYKTTGRNGAIMKIVPTIPDQTYVVSYKTNIHPDNLFYKIGRYPQTEPHYTKLKNRFFTTEKIGELYFVKDSFKVEDCLSLCASLVIGSKFKQDSFFVSDFKYILYSNKKELKLTELQRNHTGMFFKLGKYADENYATITQDSLLAYYKLEKLDQTRDLYTSRLIRWHFAYKYFKEYSILEKMIGKRLEYLSVYHKIFKTKVDGDYPHNPIISAFLYSGVLGGLLYTYFLGLSFYSYWKLRKELAIFAILYMVAFVFAFFSGNSHFSIPVFALFSLIPFLPTIKGSKTYD
ncbi:MAG: hypothetical protein A2X15_12505 [Bacteroidetes bacterium GWB2_32_14]|nr:MAG: hypothetical protein A2X15_12505 [Bacteroidetes bacterium GWB2_32_14]OFX67751.1 MAG: hypothetical protein A2X14_06330 [Bacteroidetes bacterium GWD2_33_33]